MEENKLAFYGQSEDETPTEEGLIRLSQAGIKEIRISPKQYFNFCKYIDDKYGKNKPSGLDAGFIGIGTGVWFSWHGVKMISE